MVERNSVGIGFDEHGLVQQLEDALGCSHRGLQDVEFLAEVLDRTKETLRKHGERGENPKSEPAGENADTAGPINQGYGREAEKFDCRIEEGVSENGVAPSEHIVAIALLKFIHGLVLAVEELHNAHA